MGMVVTAMTRCVEGGDGGGGGGVRFDWIPFVLHVFSVDACLAVER